MRRADLAQYIKRKGYETITDTSLAELARLTGQDRRFVELQVYRFLVDGYPSGDDKGVLDSANLQAAGIKLS